MRFKETDSVVRDTAGDTLYTRAGNFQLDGTASETATGQFVQGWSATDGVVNTNSAIGNIIIPSDPLHQPSATQNFTTSFNWPPMVLWERHGDLFGADTSDRLLGRDSHVDH